MNRPTSQKEKIQERTALEEELELTRAEVKIEEAKAVEEQDSGRLGWLENHTECLINKIKGAFKCDHIAYEILK